MISWRSVRNSGLFLLGLLVWAGLLEPAYPQVRRKYATPPRVEELSEAERALVAKIEAMAVPLKEEQVMYHYGSKGACDRLNSGGTYTGELFERYSRLPEGEKSLAGHGIYIASDPLSSLDYFSGGATRVHLAPGTRVLDLSNPVIEDSLEMAGIRRADVKNLPLDVVVKYDGMANWSVVKGASGVRFETMDFESMARELRAHPPSSTVQRVFLKSGSGIIDQVLKRQREAGDPAQLRFLQEYFGVLLDSPLGVNVEEALADRVPASLAIIPSTRPELREKWILAGLERLESLARGSPDWSGTVLKTAARFSSVGDSAATSDFVRAGLARLLAAAREHGELSLAEQRLFHVLAALPGSQPEGAALLEGADREALREMLHALRPEAREKLFSGLGDFLHKEDFVGGLWSLVRFDRKASERVVDALGASARGLYDLIPGSPDGVRNSTLGRIEARYIQLFSDPALFGRSKAGLPRVIAAATVDAIQGQCALALTREIRRLEMGGGP